MGEVLARRRGRGHGRTVEYPVWDRPLQRDMESSERARSDARSVSGNEGTGHCSHLPPEPFADLPSTLIFLFKGERGRLLTSTTTA